MSPAPGFGRVEQLAQAVAERVVSIVIDALDIDAILNRIDVDSLIDRVDVDKIIDRVDVDSLMEKTELGSIIARSTTSVASDVLDVIRAQGVGLDDFFARWANRTLRRNPADLPLGPATLVEAQPAEAELPSGAP